MNSKPLAGHEESQHLTASGLSVRICMCCGEPMTAAMIARSSNPNLCPLCCSQPAEPDAPDTPAAVTRDEPANTERTGTEASQLKPRSAEQPTLQKEVPSPTAVA